MSGYIPLKVRVLAVHGFDESLRAMRNPRMSHDRATRVADLALASKLIRAGDEHAKAIRGCIVWLELEMQIGFMVEMDTYRIGVETLSTSSTMHIDHKELRDWQLAEAKQAHLPDVIYHRTLTASYQALRRIYLQRRHHRHPDWQVFCDAIRMLPHFDSLIYPEEASYAAHDRQNDAPESMC